MEDTTQSKAAPQSSPATSLDSRLQHLVLEAQRRAPLDVAKQLLLESDETVGMVLQHLHQAPAYRILLRFPSDRRDAIVKFAGDHVGDPWEDAQKYPEGSVGQLMEPPVAVFAPDTRVDRAVEMIREWTHDTLITYGYIVDPGNQLLGVVAMRDLLLAGPADQLQDVMLRNPFSLRPDESVGDAMKEVVYRHYPIYPVCDAEGQLLGIVQGFMLFEHQNFELSAQYGSMVGVDKEEHADTPWTRAFKMRHPWLQINLLTAFLAAFVVGFFEDTIAQLVVLAAFLPVLAGQSGNTGCQSLAVSIRAITLHELKPGSVTKVLMKEIMLGLTNGLAVGVVAGAAMYWYAAGTEGSEPLILGLVVFLAMTGSCLASGISGILIPVTLKRCGLDPAMASSIFLTTATDVVSMGLFLWLANVLVLN
jgi:magnesium transporter